MISHLHIENFKSLVDVDLSLGTFNCLIGLNGAGKSTLLQAMDFIAHVSDGDVKEWLASRDWKKNELTSSVGVKKHIVAFTIRIQPEKGPSVEWKARFNVNQLKCTWEQVTLGSDIILKLEEGKFEAFGVDMVRKQSFETVPLEYEGSVLSVLKIAHAHPSIGEVKQHMKGLRSLELLSPRDLRRRAKKAEDIGIGGEKLSAFLSSFSPEQRESLLKRLQKFYPNLKGWQVQTLRAGWKNLRVVENYQSDVVIDASHMNDGLLRVLAILAQSEGQHRFLLFDEIENGFNPALAGMLVDALIELGTLGKQVLVTTHSPVLLNYLDDEVAKASVQLVFRTPQGQTKTCKYFDQPETRTKLGSLGPGEVFVDTDLQAMVARLSDEAMVLENK
jgi:predicted ATPase